MAVNRGIVRGLPATGTAPLAGGVTGQILTKRSDDNYDTAWDNPISQWGSRAPRGVIPDDSDGWFWWDGIVATNQSWTSVNLYGMFQPFTVRQTMNIRAIRTNITNAQVGGILRQGIYPANNNWEPQRLLCDFGTVDASTNGNKTISGLSIRITPGRYFLYQEGNAAFTVNGYRASMQSVDYVSYGWNLYRDTGLAAPLPTNITPLGRSALGGGFISAMAVFQAVPA